MSHLWICFVLVFIWRDLLESVRCTLIRAGPDKNIIYPYWAALDRRPIPAWYDEDKFGIMLHWGVYSVPAFKDEWFWQRWRSGDKDVTGFMSRNYPDSFKYEDFANLFTAEYFNATSWAEIFYNAGAKYVVLTSKHHDGYALWPSSVNTEWNSVATGPKRDLVGELCRAVKEKGMRFGVYYSLLEWYNPLYVNDSLQNFKRQEYVKRQVNIELRELVVNYELDILWTSGDMTARDGYFHSTEFLGWLYNDSPVKTAIVVNDRWGRGTRCRHGGVYTCKEKKVPLRLKTKKWENCYPIDKYSWGYRRDANVNEYSSPGSLIRELVMSVSYGGNFLMNLGPTKEGTFDSIFYQRLQTVGAWLHVNGEAIYKTLPWTYQKDGTTTNVFYTHSRVDEYTIKIFAIILKWPHLGVLKLNALISIVETIVNMRLLGYEGELTWKILYGNAEKRFTNQTVITVELPKVTHVKDTLGWTLVVTTSFVKNVPGG